MPDFEMLLRNYQSQCQPLSCMWPLDHPTTNQPFSSRPYLSPLLLDTVERKHDHYVIN